MLVIAVLAGLAVAAAALSLAAWRSPRRELDPWLECRVEPGMWRYAGGAEKRVGRGRRG